MIHMERVTKRYANGIVAVNNTSLRIEQGEFVYIIGPSGSGKSTLIKLINREVQASQGRIQVGPFALHQIKDKDIPMLRRYVGVVFQDFKLLDRLNVYENVAYALEVTGIAHKEIDRRVMGVLDLVGLRHKIKQYPPELSGGEQQRVAIARALVGRPKILVADEPTGNLDPGAAQGIVELLEEINRGGTTVIMGTHNNQIVEKYRHRVLRIEKGHVISDHYKGAYA